MNVSEVPQQESALKVNLTNLADLMDDISTWTWLSIFLFFLIFPPIVLLVKYIKLILVIDKLHMVTNDKDLHLAYKYFIIGLILALFMVGAIVSYILYIVGYKKLHNWAERYAAQRQTEASKEFANHIHTIYLGYILSIIIVGIFIIPIGFSHAANALKGDLQTFQTELYAGPMPTSAHINESTTAPTADLSQQSIEEAKEQLGGYGFCKHCGTPLRTPNDKFCRNCGQKIE
ncbi:MAG: zinc ribbon domain-containing protein [Promethearchaeota archaeon]